MPVQWADPPANAVKGGERQTKSGETAESLRANPGKWANVTGERPKPSRQAAVTLTNTIRLGKRAEFQPAGAFDSAYAPNPEDPNRYDVFAQYVDPSSNGATPVAQEYAADLGDDGPWEDDEV